MKLYKDESQRGKFRRVNHAIRREAAHQENLKVSTIHIVRLVDQTWMSIRLQEPLVRRIC